MASGEDSSDGAITVVGAPASSSRAVEVAARAGEVPVLRVPEDDDEDEAEHDPTRVRADAPPASVRQLPLPASRRCPACGAPYPLDFLLCPRDGTPLTDPASERDDPLVGTVLGDTYRIVRRVGGGGMGGVYEARHLRLRERRVAVKILHRELAFHPEMAIRFQREAESASAIAHPNVMDVFDVANLPDGTPYFVGEFVEGEELSALLRRERLLEPSKAVNVVRQVCRALAAAHARGIVHRDVKPENVMVRRVPAITGGAQETLLVKVLDFGISKVRAAADLTHITQVGTILGTPSFMAPEQAAGKSVDARSDVYSAGALLYTALTGQAPFDGDDATTVLSMVLTREAPPLRSINPHVPEALERVVERAMARDVTQRYGTMADLDRALAPFDVGGVSPAVLAASLVPAAAPPAADAKGRLVFASVVLFAGILLGATTALTALVTLVNHGNVGWLESILVLAGCVIASAAPLVSYVLFVQRVVWPNHARTEQLAAKLWPVAITCLATYAALGLSTGTAKTLGLLSPLTFPSDLFVLTGTLVASAVVYVRVARRRKTTTAA